MTNSIRPAVVASLLVNGEAQDAVIPKGMRTAHRPHRAVSLGEKKPQTKKLRGRQQVVGVGMTGRFNVMKRGDLFGSQKGVHVP